ncbi:gamma-glutamyltransferase family protein [Rhodalgimonas zhirmunskyi]|uniref:Gamma-glutamyltransferase family protein n=1 Tax=Rhodalgimonas zhirmunskyi TaxID=2964767 RepID=A0AAJ1X607_9RHOB|nr:gamma-glutamyltransferase family protein [Rhodoalgimonas zhirmunskyi]MDQ2094209.1 gamma-glutamyltransferase family protein [Rhodoalgimonas zhirmunskyi]
MRDFHFPGRSPVLAENGVCATSHPLAAKAAVQVLEDGGNAMDAAIAGAVLLGICEPQMTGIGGDCFVLFKPAGSEQIKALNGSGRAPAAASAAALRERGLDAVPLYSAEAVTIPTAVDAFCRLNTDWGKLDLARVLAPAIHYAEAGVPVAPRVAFDWPEAAKALSGHGLKHYMPWGEPPAVGTMFRAPGQAEVLRKIAAQGREGFYTGEVAEDMVAALQDAGGVHTLEDFAAAESFYSEPVSGEYKGVELVEHAPNGQGATAILMLKILSHFDIAGMEPFGAKRAHIEAEAAKLAYDARNRFIADPDHTNRLEHMMSDATAAALAAKIDPDKAMDSPEAVSESVHKDTIYITVVDKDRMAVSLIYSIYHGFGSGIASERFGVLFQNRGAGFTLKEGHPNELQGGKRPMHTIIPGMLRREGRVIMPFGVMGGAYQPNGHARFVSNMVDFGMEPQDAFDAPRSFSDNGVMNVEKGYDSAVRDELTAMGHKVAVPDGPIGGSQGILLREDGVLEGASDPRKDGIALGY